MLATRSLCCLIAIFLGVLNPQVSFGQYQNLEAAKDRLSAEDYRLFSKGQQSLQSFGDFDTKIDFQGRRAIVFNRKTGQQVMEIPFANNSELRKTSPEALAKEFLRGVRASQPGKTMQETLKAFPMESLVFFMAVGAVVAAELSYNYAENPVGMQAHIDHHLSPIGAFGFFVFMYMSRMSQKTLSVWIKNPRFQHFIPYLGMSAGFFSQSFLTGFLLDPNFQSCIKSVYSKKPQVEGASEKPCEDAFSATVIGGRLWEMAPGLVSMLASTFAAGMIQRYTIQGVAKLVGVEVAMMLMPGGMGVKGIRFVLTNASQIAVFYWLDVHVFNRYITAAWKNFWDGRDMASIDRSLLQSLNNRSNQKWSANPLEEECLKSEKKSICETTLIYNLKRLTEKGRIWRMISLLHVHEIHSYWLQALENLNSWYSLSFDFYRELTDELRSAKFYPENPNRLFRTYPLFGVEPSSLRDDRKFLLFSNPAFVDRLQVEHIQEIGKNFGEFISSRRNEYSPSDLKLLEEIRNGLVSDDPTKIGLAIVTAQRAHRPGDNRHLHQSQLMQKTLQGLVNAFGSARPKMLVGQGFVDNFARYSSSASLVKELKTPYNNGAYQVEDAADYLFIQTVCGPDGISDPIVSVKKGFAAKFEAPRIVKQKIDNCRGTGILTSDAPYRVSVKSNSTGKVYKNITDLLSSETLPEVLGNSSQSGFVQWWESKVTHQMISAYNEFAKEYSRIAAKIIENFHISPDEETLGQKILGLFRTRNYNPGYASPNVLTSIEQEYRTYILILGEIARSIEKNGDLPSIPQNQSGNRKNIQANSLFLATSLSPIYSVQEVMALLNGTALATSEAFIFQRNLENAFQTILGLLRQIRVSEEKIILPFTQAEFRQSIAVLDTYIQELEESLVNKISSFNRANRHTANACLEGLKSLSLEIQTLESMIFTASWDWKSANSEEQKKARAKRDKMINDLKSLMR
ncbi:MAG: hypothetical protein N2578_00060 [Bdellovibrionaceae bacterium]|nr:hypothetical protein [Pseudobdellovibrionaceae bacterium]